MLQMSPRLRARFGKADLKTSSASPKGGPRTSAHHSLQPPSAAAEPACHTAHLFTELTARTLPTQDQPETVGCVTLNALRTGTLAQITGFADPQHPVSRRLFDLGFAPGVPVRLARKAPMRDPLVVEIAGSELVLRGADAKRILVRHGKSSDSSPSTTGAITS